jgi:hypothetical protein
MRDQNWETTVTKHRKANAIATKVLEICSDFNRSDFYKMRYLSTTRIQP